MAHDMRRLDGMQAGIILYRNLKDTIRTQYSMTNGRGAFLEAPLQSYYGNIFTHLLFNSPPPSIATNNYVIIVFSKLIIVLIYSMLKNGFKLTSFSRQHDMERTCHVLHCSLHGNMWLLCMLYFRS